MYSGIDIILLAIHELRKEEKFKNLKLILKAADNKLYPSIEFVRSLSLSLSLYTHIYIYIYIPRTQLPLLLEYNLISSSELESLLQEAVISYSNMLSSEELNYLYNFADAYISPYYYEGIYFIFIMHYWV